MNFFWFERPDVFDIKELSTELEDSGFSGMLLPYSFPSGDQFIKIANTIDSEKKIKYIIAIRPYVISAQYLSMINKSFNNISKDRISINLVTGWVYEKEKDIGGIQGEVNDTSSNIDRSNYLIDYVESLKNTRGQTPEFYVSVTNEIVFESVKKEKVIIPYSWYKINRFDLSEVDVMISIIPVIRKTREELDLINKDNKNQDVEYFTNHEFSLFLKELKEKKINNILITEEYSKKEKENIIDFVSDFTNKEKNIL
jgi:alkanesulfonate monooxygenase SsuD/methylene tetrahydromethanopterin reductase-like flavin-dependent oxidoreductase (luciferase family)